MSAPASFMLIFRDSTPAAYTELSPEQLAQSLDRWNEWCDGLAAEGRLQHGHPLEPQGRVVAANRVEPVLDGPFAEAKEFVGGYLLVLAEDLDEATEIARRCPNLRYGMLVEVRPVGAVCHLAKSLGRETMKA